MLYDHPRAVHPQELLVVWPLGGGNLLFADVAAKTYFTRQLRLLHTVSKRLLLKNHHLTFHFALARQISVKPQFSPRSHFLHVASLEVRVTAVERCIGTVLSIIHSLTSIAICLCSHTAFRPANPRVARRFSCIASRSTYEGRLSVSQLPVVFTGTSRDPPSTSKINRHLLHPC